MVVYILCSHLVHTTFNSYFHYTWFCCLQKNHKIIKTLIYKITPDKRITPAKIRIIILK